MNGRKIIMKKILSLSLAALMMLSFVTYGSTSATADEKLEELRAKILSQYGENKRVTDDNYDKSLAVKCVNGTFVGKKENGVIAYKGIPFVGKQPVGEFRWKAPVEFVPDDGVYEAYYNGKSPCQTESITEVGSLYVQGEDCLYLNVWKADEASSEKKPVMVWIHGGGYEQGGTADPMYDCGSLVRENPDIIAVSIAYRVGIFGFFHLSHLPDGKDYPDAQNLAIMDHMMALKWVHENIAAFGGNPDNVTIFGESAGGESVTVLPLIEGSHKYFKRVISQSGSPVLSRSTEQCIETTNEVMKILGCKTVAELQKVDVEKLVTAMASLGGMCVGPERDGKYLTFTPYEAYANGAAKDIEILQGVNKDELNYFMIEDGGAEPFIENMSKRMAKNLSVLTDNEKALVESFCNDIKGESYDPICRLFDQAWFIAPLFRLSENQTKAGGKSYTYYFTVESSRPMMKSGHAVELSTVFNHPENTQFTGRAFDETFSKTLRKMWVSSQKPAIPHSARKSPRTAKLTSGHCMT